MSKEAMKLALEALKRMKRYGNTFGYRSNEQNPYEQVCEAIEALEALAQQPAQQEPVAWKLVPREPTHEMLKAMDECSTEGYDERLYAGHAASVYMAAVDAAPTPPAQRKPLTDEEIILIVADCASSHQHTDIHFARAIERAHGIKELV